MCTISIIFLLIGLGYEVVCSAKLGASWILIQRKQHCFSYGWSLTKILVRHTGRCNNATSISFCGNMAFYIFQQWLVSKIFSWCVITLILLFSYNSFISLVKSGQVGYIADFHFSDPGLTATWGNSNIEKSPP